MGAGEVAGPERARLRGDGGRPAFIVPSSSPLGPSPPDPGHADRVGGREAGGARAVGDGKEAGGCGCATSHELGLLQSFLVRRGVPRCVTGDVGARAAARALPGRGVGVPAGRHRWGTRRQRPAVGQRATLQSRPALLHQLLELGALVLEPDLDLQERTTT